MRKLLTLIFIAILVLLNINFIKGSYQAYLKLTEISKEESKVDELEAKNLELKKELQNHDTVYFIEQEARNRLGYGKQGETTIVIESSEIGQAAREKQKQQRSNLQSWFAFISY